MIGKKVSNGWKIRGQPDTNPPANRGGTRADGGLDGLGTQPFFFWKSAMKATRASTASGGQAL